MPPLLLTCHTLKISHHISCFVLTTFRHHVVTWELDLQLSLPSIYITAFNNRLLDNEQALHFIHFSQLKDTLPLYFLVTKTFYSCISRNIFYMTHKRATRAIHCWRPWLDSKWVRAQWYRGVQGKCQPQGRLPRAYPLAPFTFVSNEPPSHNIVAAKSSIIIPELCSTQCMGKWRF
jgi:hypothetical protein